MLIEQEFLIPLPVEAAWPLLLDVERIGPCFPGATVHVVNGDEVKGGVRVKLGPMVLTYEGVATFKSKDPVAHRVVISAVGSDSKGNGNAAAEVTATLTSNGANETRCQLATDLNITGRPAQFGRGIMIDIGNRILDQFAANLAASITVDSTSAQVTNLSATSTSHAPAEERKEESLDILKVARKAALKRALPAVAVLLIIVVVAIKLLS